MGGKYATSLGIFEDDKISWLKRFEYPNSLGYLFNHNRFLGLDPYLMKKKYVCCCVWRAKMGKYAKEKIVNTELGEYTILQDLRRGIGEGALIDVARGSRYFTRMFN